MSEPVPDGGAGEVEEVLPNARLLPETVVDSSLWSE